MSLRHVRVKEDDYIILKKCTYRLVHATEQYYKKAVEILKNSGFIEDNVDPCLYVKKSAKAIVYVALYVDNNLMVGNVEAIDDAIAAHKENRLICKIMEGLKYYLSCEVKFLMDKKRAWVGQPHLIKNLAKKFGNCTKIVHSYKTPGMPKFLIVRPMMESKKISA